ncbi:MAG: hypothetical protein RI885_1458 [Actinomycetota bacterium]
MSVRLRLTLSYAGFLVLVGVGLIAVVLYALRFVPADTTGFVEEVIPNRSDLLEAVWPRIWQVLGALALVGLVGGWFLAGLMLRPLKRINSVARAVATGSPTERVRLDGPRDEFRELADTFDQMLDRLQRSFDEQRRFAANAAHELRTPMAITQSMLEVARVDPDGQDFERLITRLYETNRRGIEVIEALLALSAVEQGIVPGRSPVDLAEIAADVVREFRPLADAAGVEIITVLGEGDVDGTPTLVRQLTANLVVNAIRHNVPVEGWLRVTTVTTPDGCIDLAVENSGPVVAPGLVPRLTEPFVRGVGRVSGWGADGWKSSGGPAGSGLGLALVSRVSEVHGARLSITAMPTGGLTVVVRFPAIV